MGGCNVAGGVVLAGSCPARDGCWGADARLGSMGLDSVVSWTGVFHRNDAGGNLWANSLLLGEGGLDVLLFLLSAPETPKASVFRFRCRDSLAGETGALTTTGVLQVSLSFASTFKRAGSRRDKFLRSGCFADEFTAGMSGPKVKLARSPLSVSEVDCSKILARSSTRGPMDSEGRCVGRLSLPGSFTSRSGGLFALGRLRDQYRCMNLSMFVSLGLGSCVDDENPERGEGGADLGE